MVKMCIIWGGGYVAKYMRTVSGKIIFLNRRNNMLHVSFLPEFSETMIVSNKYLCTQIRLSCILVELFNVFLKIKTIPYL